MRTIGLVLLALTATTMVTYAQGKSLKNPNVVVSSDDVTSATTANERKAEIDNVRYVVVFDVCSDCTVSVPLTNPLGQPHYQAKIRIFVETGNETHYERALLYGPFSGQWTKDGCFEDDPKTLVEFALEEKKKQRKSQ